MILGGIKMKNHQNAPKKNHHEKTCVAHSRASDTVTTTTTAETPADIQSKAKNSKKH